MYFGKMEEKYFCGEDWTREIKLKLLRKTTVLAQRLPRDFTASDSLCRAPPYAQALVASSI
jgi:hypothetical protein